MLNLLLGRQKKSLDGGVSTLDHWPDRIGRMTQAGTLVDEATSLTYSAVFCATRVLTEGCAMLPLKLYKKSQTDSPAEATEMPQYGLTASQPNPDMPFGVFKAGRTMHQVNGGNGFAEIERERFGDPESPPVALWPIEAGRVRPATSRDTDRRGRPLKPEDRYIVRNNDGTNAYLKSWEMLHVPGVLSEDGIWGKSVIAQARQNIGAGIAMDIHSATFFSSAKAPPAVVYGAAMRDPEERRAFRKEWKEIHGSPFSGEIALLPIDATYERIGINNEEGQFLESQQMSVRKIGRFYRVAVHMLMEMMGPAGYNTVLQLSEEFVRFSLMTWLLLWEGECNQKLLTPEERKTHYFAHDLYALLKADPLTRAQIRKINIECGHWSINDAHREDGMPGIGPAGDEYYVPLNFTTADRIYRGLPPPSAPKAALPAKPAKETDDEEEVVEAAQEKKLLGLPEGGKKDGPGAAHQVALPEDPQRLPALAAAPVLAQPVPEAPKPAGLSGDNLYLALRLALKGPPSPALAPALPAPHTSQGSGRNAAAMTEVARGLGKLAKAVTKQKPVRVSVTPQISVAAPNVGVQQPNIVNEIHLPPMETQISVAGAVIQNNLTAPVNEIHLPAAVNEIHLPAMQVTNSLPEMSVHNTMTAPVNEIHVAATVNEINLPEMRPQISLPPMKVTNKLPKTTVQNTVNLPALRADIVLPEMQPHFHVEAAEPAPAPQVVVENQVDVHVQPPQKVVESIKDVTERDEDGNIRTVRETFEYDEEAN